MRKIFISFVTMLMLSAVTAFAADLQTIATMTVAAPTSTPASTPIEFSVGSVSDGVKIVLTVTEGKDVIAIANDKIPTEANVGDKTLTFEFPYPENGEVVIKVSDPSAITGLNCEENYLTTLTVTGLEKLTDLKFSGNKLTELTLSGLKRLQTLSFNGGSLTTLTVTGLDVLNTLDVSGNVLTTLDITELEALTKLNVSGNALTTLDVSTNVLLDDLDASGNALTTLDLSVNTGLTTIDASNNKLVTLVLPATNTDLSANTALTKLDVSMNSLTELDVTELTGLATLNCYDNLLTTLDLSKNNLKSLDASMNRLAVLKLYVEPKDAEGEAKDKLAYLQANGQRAVAEVPFDHNGTDVDITFDGKTQTVSVGGTFSFASPGTGADAGAGFSGTLVSIVRGDDDRKRYDITFVPESGVEVIMASGVNQAIAGHDYQFGVLLSDEFADYSVKVLVDGEELLPFLNTYIIEKVDGDKEVTFILTKENPTSNETLTATSVSTTKGAITVEAIASDVMIVSISGNVVYKAIVTGTETVNVAAGIYVVAINGKATKVVVR